MKRFAFLPVYCEDINRYVWLCTYYYKTEAQTCYDMRYYYTRNP